MSLFLCRFSNVLDVALPIQRLCMMSRMITVFKKLAWWLLVLLILLVGAWLCWLAYYAWPIAIDSVGELPDLP